MIKLPYSLVIEATQEVDYFGFYSPDLEGFTGIGHSIEDCLYQAKWGMVEHINLLKEQGLPVPPRNANPEIIVRNEERTGIPRVTSGAYNRPISLFRARRRWARQNRAVGM